MTTLFCNFLYCSHVVCLPKECVLGIPSSSAKHCDFLMSDQCHFLSLYSYSLITNLLYFFPPGPSIFFIFVFDWILCAPCTNTILKQEIYVKLFISRAAVVHLNSRSGSTFPVSVCTALHATRLAWSDFLLLIAWIYFY